MNSKLNPIEKKCINIEHNRDNKYSLDNWYTLEVSKKEAITVENHLKDIQASFFSTFNRYGHVVFEVYL